MLGLLEKSRAESGLDMDDQVGLVRYALTGYPGGPHWAILALEWAADGLRDAVASDLRLVVDDHSRPQPLRHQALRLLNGRADWRVSD